MKKKSATFFNNSIPHDLLIETILIRLPVKSLIRFKSVCKLWLSSIQDPYFIDLHYAYSYQHRRRFLLTYSRDQRVWANYRYHAVLVDPEGETAHLFDFFLFKIVSRYRGLILYVSHLGHCVVCNPSTKERVILPDLRKDDLQMGTQSEFHLGYDRRSKVYKVLHLKIMVPNAPYSYDYYCARCDVVTLGGGGDGGVWREIDQLPPYHIQSRHVAYVNGVIHWKNRGECPLRPPDEQVLVAFDFADEKFSVIPLPEYIFASTEDNMGYSQLLQVVEEGQMALGDSWNSTNINTITLWILEDYAKQTWIQKRFDMPLDMQQDMCRFIGVLANGQVIMRHMRIKPIFCLYYHDLVKQVSRKVEFTRIPSQAFCPNFQFGSHVTVTQFVESLHSCNGKIDKYPKGMNFTDDGLGVLLPFMADKIRRLC
ncbi:hypothetical protein ACHQM5_013443 [Ranunculus cassubicifolius]